MTAQLLGTVLALLGAVLMAGVIMARARKFEPARMIGLSGRPNGRGNRRTLPGLTCSLLICGLISYPAYPKQRVFSMKMLVSMLAVLALLLGTGAPCRAGMLTADQQDFANMLSIGPYYYPVVSSGSMQGDLASFDAIGIAVGNDGFFRSLLKGVGGVSAVVAGGAAGFLVAGPVGAGVGAGAGGVGWTSFATSLNNSGPGPGRQWLISDARVYNQINVSGVGNILPTVEAVALSNITATTTVFPGVTVSFVNPSIFPISILDQNLNHINTISGDGIFLEQSSSGIAIGSYVLNTIGFSNSIPLTTTDYIDINLGSILSVPDGTSIEFQSTPFIGASSVPEPASLTLLVLGIAGIGAMGYAWRPKPVVV